MTFENFINKACTIRFNDVKATIIRCNHKRGAKGLMVVFIVKDVDGFEYELMPHEIKIS